MLSCLHVSCEVSRASWLVQVWLCELSRVSWLGKLARAIFLVRVGSCSCQFDCAISCASWLVQVWLSDLALRLVRRKTWWAGSECQPSPCGRAKLGGLTSWCKGQQRKPPNVAAKCPWKERVNALTALPIAKAKGKEARRVEGRSHEGRVNIRAS